MDNHFNTVHHNILTALHKLTKIVYDTALIHIGQKIVGEDQYVLQNISKQCKQIMDQFITAYHQWRGDKGNQAKRLHLLQLRRQRRECIRIEKHKFTNYLLNQLKINGKPWWKNVQKLR